MVIIGADVVNHYPSLDKTLSARTAKQAMLETDVQFSGVNYREAARYCALEMSETEIRMSKLRRIIPTRRYSKGTRPSIIGPLPLGPSTDDDCQWVFPKRNITNEDKKLLLATVMEIAVRTVFETHVYQFAGKMYHQQQGGPIGLRATGAISRIVMADWDGRLLQQLLTAGLAVEEAARYVPQVQSQEL